MTDDLNKIEEIVSEIEPSEPKIGNSVVDFDYRNSELRWLPPEQHVWLAERMGYIARMLNGQYYGFDLSGFGEAFQHTTYSVAEPVGRLGISVPEASGHYDWHMDTGNMEMCRKLSLVLMLNDEYKGGDLEILGGRDPIKAEKIRGRVYGFPSYILHRVTPVTKGTRKTLVAWVSGPKFR